MSDRSRRIAQQRLVDAATRHTTYLYRRETGQYNQLRSIIDAAAGSLASELADRLDNLTPAELEAFTAGRYTTNRLKGLRSLINDWAATLGREVDEALRSGLEEIAGNEASFAQRMLNSVLQKPVDIDPLSARAIYASAMRKPAMGVLVTEMLQEMHSRTRRQVYSRIRSGISSGETSGQIVRALRGTRALQYRDGIFQGTRVEAERIVRTATNHVSNSAFADTWEAMGVDEVVDVATLDGRTSKYCAGVDGRRHRVGTNHPRPPYHYNCRTIQVPALSAGIMGERPYVRAFEPLGKVPKGDRTKGMVGTVSARTTYSDWFARQPASYQREWLGPTRYRLYREGGYEISRFTDPMARQYSIAELRAQDAATFRELFG